MSDMQTINSALIQCFDLESLTQVVRFGLDVDIEAIAGGSDFTARVFSLTRWAQRHGRLDELLDKARQYNNNPLLAQLSAPAAVILEKRSMDEQQYATFEILNLRIQQIQRDLDKFQSEIKDELHRLQKIVEGPDGGNGLRSEVRENSRKSEQNMQAILEIKPILSKLSESIREFEHVTASNDILATPQSRVVFSLFFILLSLILMIVVAGQFGWI